jgi:hypothetical protein
MSPDRIGQTTFSSCQNADKKRHLSSAERRIYPIARHSRALVRARFHDTCRQATLYVTSTSFVQGLSKIQNPKVTDLQSASPLTWRMQRPRGRRPLIVTSDRVDGKMLRLEHTVLLEHGGLHTRPFKGVPG